MITSVGLRKLGFVPHTDYVLEDAGQGVYIAKWNSASPQPSEASIEAAHAEWEAEQVANAYRVERAKAYPSIGDQLDSLFHAGAFPADMAAQLQAVKDQYPAE